MKSNIFSILILGALALMLSSCGNQEKREQEMDKQQELFAKDLRGMLKQHMQIKLDIMEEKLDLSKKDFKRFEELYREYSSELMSLHRQREKTRKRDMTQEQITQSIFDANDRMRKSIDLREVYFYKFVEFMTPLQIDKMYQLEKAIEDQHRVEMRGRMQRIKGNSQTRDNAKSNRDDKQDDKQDTRQDVKQDAKE